MRKLAVNTAVEVLVNHSPLLDDTDFKTREVAIAYDAGGMDLVWNFTDAAGAITQTAVTPTTGGDYDWAHVGDGIYKIEIPASGGASINNDEIGIGFFSGFATGVVPWRGPDYAFVPAAELLNAVIPKIEVSFTSTAGTTADIRIWVERPNGAKVDLSDYSTTTASVTFHPLISGAALFTQAFTAGEIRNNGFEIQKSTPGFSDDTQYAADISVVLDGVTYRAMDSRVVFG